MDISEICFLTIGQLAPLIQKREVSPVEVTDLLLERIREVDGRTNAFITVMADEALSAARQAEREITQGRYRGPLHGVPIGLKDLYYTRGVRTTAGSKIRAWAEFVPGEDATVVERFKEAGAVIIGKLNMHEFAAGATNENPHYGPTRNPWDLERITGGSSGGSGAAVAASLCSAAMGSDTGGSVRIPACLCGIVGLKPTFGRVSCFGVVPLSWSLDHPGPMTRSVEDAALVMNAISGYDPRDPASADVPVPDFTEGLGLGISGMRIGIPRTFFFERIDSEVRDAVGRAIAVLSEMGAIMEEVSLPHIEYSPHLRNTISLAESAVYHGALLKDHAEELTPNVRDRLELGQLILATQYIKVQRARSIIKDDFIQALRGVDVLVTPTTAIPAPRLGQRNVVIEGHEEATLDSVGRFTRPLNQAGLPACTVPCGFTSEGLPVGLQIAGRAFDEATVLRVAHAYEQATDWHPRRPPL